MLWLSPVLEWSGGLGDIAGAMMLATNTRYSPYAYVVFMLSSACLSLFAVLNGHWGLLTSQMAFLGINVYGAYNWLVRPALEERRASATLR